ncbi:MAG: sugar ABC transporter permease [Clostridiales bacterium]|nr:sugar ABC transporter permease [Clostridiales bacterium]
MWFIFFLAPYVIGLLVFWIGPVIASIFISFTKWELVGSPVWVGFNNYKQLFSDEIFIKSLINTAYYTILSVPLSMICSLLLAVAMNQKLKGIVVFRTAFFMPYISSMVAVALLWSWIYNPQYGILNYFLELIGIPGQNWLGDPKWAMPALVFMSVWKGLGYNMMIWLAALQGIPEDLYEAARIDGANKWQQFKNITVPLLSPTTFMLLILSIINSFKVFEQSYIMTKGGPAHATMTMVLYIYSNAFVWLKMGYASAMAYILAIIILVLTVIQLRLQKKWVHY